MNFDQAKALRLQQWRSTLDDHDFRMQNPEAHRQTLHEMSSALVTEGLIDELQQFDLNEMANAAYWHAVEELQTIPGRYCGASTYDVMRHGSTELPTVRDPPITEKFTAMPLERTWCSPRPGLWRESSGLP
jgi:hypothetical protein